MAARLSNIRTVTSLVTPFTDGAIDCHALTRALDCQRRAGVDAVVVCDVAGEGYALRDDERDLVLSTCVERAQGRLAVIAATGTYGTARSLALTKRAQQLGADGLLVTVPYYSKPTKAGVVAHFRNVAEATHLPVIIDDDPQRNVIEGGAALLQALSDMPNVVGIRHGDGRLSAFVQLDPILRRRYHHYCGEGGDLSGFLACGGHGVISCYGNLFPFRLVALGRGFPGAAADVRREMTSLLGATAGQWDAAVVKAACAILRGDPETVRLPLVALDTTMRDGLRQVLTTMQEPAGSPQPQAVA